MGSEKGYLETESCRKASGTSEGSQSGCHGMTRGELRVGSRETSGPGSAQGALLLMGGQCKEWWTPRGG